MFGKLAFWHSDLYRSRHMDEAQEHWLKMSLALCPQLSEAVDSLARLYVQQKRFDEAVAVVRQARIDDPRNEYYLTLVKMVDDALTYGKRAARFGFRAWISHRRLRA